MEDTSRTVTVPHDQAKTSALQLTYSTTAESVLVHGKDHATGELVKFRMSATTFWKFYEGAQDRANSDILVSPDKIISVESDPEWDSPGTSPED